MRALWILGIVCLLLLWLCMTRVGAQITLTDGSAAVNIRFGAFRFRVYPPKKKKDTEKKQENQKKPSGAPKKAMPKPGLEDIKSAVAALWPPLKRALDRTRRGIRMDPMDVRVTLGGAEDPAATAELYGYLNAGVWTGMPLLEKAIRIPAPYIHLGMDFDASKTSVEGKLGVTARIGTLLGVALGVAIPALRWFMQFRKKTQKPAPQPAA